MDYLYKMDHYDAYTYISVGPISFLSSLSFILLNIYFKEARRFPGNILIIISLAELILCVHWFISGLFTKYVLGGNEINENENFCVINSYMAVFSGSIEYYFQLSFLISISIMFRNTLKEIKFKYLFVILPFVASVTSLILLYLNDGLGKNIYGTCSLKQFKKSGTLYFIGNGLYLSLVIYTLYRIRAFIKASQGLIIRDDFYKFYINYSILIFIIYLVVSLNYPLVKFMMDCIQDKKEDFSICLKWFYISRLANNLKIFIPFFTFLLRIRDPFIRKLWLRVLRTENNKDNFHLEELKTQIIIDDDYLINNEIKQIRTSIIRTILHGLGEFFTKIQPQIQEINDDILEKISKKIKGNEEKLKEQFRKTSEINEMRILEAYMISFYSKGFYKLQKEFKVDFKNSFDINLNRKSINEVGELEGGKGGEFFLMTFDKRFIIKTMNEDEELVFKNLASDLITFYIDNKNTFIGKIYGLFQYKFTLGDQVIRIFIMENVFPKIKIDRKYDLKGSTYSRSVLKSAISLSNLDRHSVIQKTLKDIDFNKIEKNFEMTPNSRKILIDQINKDVEFFVGKKIIDFSLLIGVVELSKLSIEEKEIIKEFQSSGRVFFDFGLNFAIIVGIIDYFQVYTWSKFFEKYFKVITNLNPKLDTSSQPPNYYGIRFKKYIENIFILKEDSKIIL